MATIIGNKLYALGKKGLLEGIFQLNLIGATPMRVGLVKHVSVTPDPATHQYWGQFAAGVIGTPVNIANPLTTGGSPATHGTYSADPTLFPSLAGPNTVDSINIYRFVTADGSSPLLVYIDTGTNLPFTSNNGNVTIQWHTSGIFAI